MEVKVNGITGLIRDIFKSKEKEIQQKSYQKHEELLDKVKKTPEYQEFQKKLDDLDKQQVHRNIERLSFRSSDQNANRKELEKNAIEQGVAQAVAISLDKFGLASR